MNYCNRFHVFHRFYSTCKIHRVRTNLYYTPFTLRKEISTVDFVIIAVFSKELFFSPKKSLVKLESTRFFGATVLAVNVVNHVSQPEGPSSVYVKSRLEQSCIHSASEILNLVEEVSVAVTNCSIQYKNNLNELITSIETYKSLGNYSVLREECEQAIIIARATVTDSKKEFLDLITIFESVHRVASAVSELSFLIASESSALKLFEAVDALQIQVNEEMEEVKKLENKCLSVEKSMIESINF